MQSFDLLSTVEYGGCSAKLPAAELSRALSGLPSTPSENLLVDIETHDDGGVFRISDDLALIQTTDFFTPVCSDPYEFGQIAAANALSDVYAMGGEVLTALNIVAFPAHIPLDVLREILKGGIQKVKEAGGVIMGGHTIVDDTPKYGLAVTGTIHPEKIITNAAARQGDVLLLAKPLGAGVIMAGKRIGMAEQTHYRTVIESMKQLNKGCVPVMQKYGVRCATDITGYGLAGHALKMAKASGVTLKITAGKVPVFDGAMDLLNTGCIPGACFRNLEYAEQESVFQKTVSYEQKMMMMDAQTSGGLFICCNPLDVNNILREIIAEGFTTARVIGEVLQQQGHCLEFE